MYNTDKNKQKFFGGGLIDDSYKKLGKNIKFHTDEINCITLCPQRRLAATGQIGMKPWVFIWETVKCVLLKKIRMKKGSKGITSMCFSPNKPYKLAILDCSPNHIVWIYDIDPMHEEPISKIETGNKEKYDIEWGLKKFLLEEVDQKTIKSLETWKRKSTLKTSKRKKEDEKEKNSQEEEAEKDYRILNVIAVTGNNSAKFITFEMTEIQSPEINFGVTMRKSLYDYTCA